MSNYDGGSSENGYRGNGVTKYVLERIDALDDKMDMRWEAVARAVEETKAKLTEHTSAHTTQIAEKERRKRQLLSAAKWVGGAVLTVLTAVLGARGL